MLDFIDSASSDVTTKISPVPLRNENSLKSPSCADFRPGAIAVADIVEQAVALSRRRAAKRGVSVQTCLADGAATRTDARSLMWTIDSLIRASIEQAPRGAAVLCNATSSAGQISIRVECRQPHDRDKLDASGAAYSLSIPKAAPSRPNRRTLGG